MNKIWYRSAHTGLIMAKKMKDKYLIIFSHDHVPLQIIITFWKLKIMITCYRLTEETKKNDHGDDCMN